MNETVKVPVAELDELKSQAAKVPSLEERHRVLSGFMQNDLPGDRRPRQRSKRPLTPQQKADYAKRKAVRNAQREARRMNRSRKRRR